MENGTVRGNGSSASGPPSPSQRYLSTRGDDGDVSFEDAVVNGVAADGGLYLPEEIPSATDWQSWKDLPFDELSYEILSLYVSASEVPAEDLRSILRRSYSTFRTPQVAPLMPLAGDDNLYLLELFHGPSFASGDVTLQFLGNLLEYFLERKGRGGAGGSNLTVLESTDGPSIVHGLRGKKGVSAFILHPKGQPAAHELQSTTILDENIHNLAVAGDLDDCQAIINSLRSDPDTTSELKLGTVSSANWARILAQIVYYFHAYFSLARQRRSFELGDQVRFAVPTGSFGSALAGYIARRMGLPIDKLVVATNEHDSVLENFWATGRYEKKKPQEAAPDVEGHARRTLSPDMDVPAPGNMERLLWYLAFEFAAGAGMDDEWNRKQAGQEVAAWFKSLETSGGFGPVYVDTLESARQSFEYERVSDRETLEAIRSVHDHHDRYVLDPHSAVGVEAARRSAIRAGSGNPATTIPHIALLTAHPVAFGDAVSDALGGREGFSLDGDIVPLELRDLDKREQRVTAAPNDWRAVGDLVKALVAKD